MKNLKYMSKNFCQNFHTLVDEIRKNGKKSLDIVDTFERKIIICKKKINPWIFIKCKFEREI